MMGNTGDQADCRVRRGSFDTQRYAHTGRQAPSQRYLPLRPCLAGNCNDQLDATSDPQATDCLCCKGKMRSRSHQRPTRSADRTARGQAQRPGERPVFCRLLLLHLRNRVPLLIGLPHGFALSHSTLDSGHAIDLPSQRDTRLKGDLLRGPAQVSTKTPQ